MAETSTIGCFSFIPEIAIESNLESSSGTGEFESSWVDVILGSKFGDALAESIHRKTWT